MHGSGKLRALLRNVHIVRLISFHPNRVRREATQFAVAPTNRTEI